jgi:hypothetical protein
MEKKTSQDKPKRPLTKEDFEKVLRVVLRPVKENTRK